MKPSSLALWLVATLISSPLLAADLQFVDELPLTTTPKRWLEQRLGVLLAPDYDRASLLGHHYSFRQLVNGLPVATTQAAVSVDGDGRPWRLYHNLRPLQSTAPGCDASGTLDPLLATLRTDDNQIETKPGTGETAIPWCLPCASGCASTRQAMPRPARCSCLPVATGSRSLAVSGIRQLPTLCMSPMQAI